MDHRKKHSKDELIELVYHLGEIHSQTIEALKEHKPPAGYEKDLDELQKEGVLILGGGKVELTEKGTGLAENIMRRHRLAEVLLTDVLGKAPDEIESAACEFEHILAPEIVDSICILLGHPKRCPHGLPIPEGDCCKKESDKLQSAVLPLSAVKTGIKVKVASINSTDETRMLKLMAMGMTPGTEVMLNQKIPALVVDIDGNLLALDKSIGEEINVWRPKGM
ncbi:MAG: metal-dependent transcriptional regulator [Nitrospinota bacterium]|nr:metal-dependent transcriptional regulator [Nitrospinota bacterium]